MTALFAGTIVLSAALLFTIQPLVARMLLPRLGGTPATWNTCLLFFQTTLLVGYLYVHAATSRLRHRHHVVAHIAVLVAAALMLPIGIPPTAPTEGSNPVAWLLATLTISIALPLVAVSATAPLLQRWYSQRTDRDPYFLYAASNTGSLVGLLAYPLLLEPTFTLASQRQLWSIGLGIVVVLVAVCGLLTPQASGATTSTDSASIQSSAPALGESWRDRLWWLALSFVPSSLLLGVTTHISTDVAAVPLLWVVPLAIYLATFIVAFGTPAHSLRAWANRLAPIAIVAALARIIVDGEWWSAVAIHLVTFAVIALVCHRELAERRPPASDLTRFYLWVSVGGALGGLFNALVAPALFTQIVEYPLALIAAALVKPSPRWRGGLLEPLFAVVALPALILLITTGVWAFGLMPGVGASAALVAVGLCLSVGLAFINRTAPFVAALVVVAVAHLLLPHQQANRVMLAERSFFGVHRGVEDSTARVNLLFHGTTLHGWQPLDARGDCEPTSYYHRDGPIGQLFASLGTRVRSAGLIGLGAGALACYGRDDTTFTFYEIDPVVERVAKDARLFTFLANARGTVGVVIGDGRITLDRAAPESLDVIVVDAFSSDAIPVHLLTREFVAMALARLRPDGVLAFHISNRHLDLAPILGATAAALRTAALEQYYGGGNADASPSRWVVMSRTPSGLDFLSTDPKWRAVRAAGHDWTDDFSNIFDVLRWSAASATGVY